MKKILTLFAFLLTSTILFSAPAFNGIFKVIQKDGTTIDIKRIGDEFFNYTTTTDGYIIEESDGIYYYSTIAFDGTRAISKIKANNPNARTSSERSFLSTKSTSKSIPYLSSIAKTKRMSRSSQQTSKAVTTGSPKGLVILANFKDVKYSIATANQEIKSMLNDEGYSENGAIGSARDYFIDNSAGAFTPDFDIVGPVELPQNMAYYGANGLDGDDSNPQQMVIDACDVALSNGLDFSPYDSNNDGFVDMVFIYFAGHNEAEGGPASAIWPHKWNLSAPYQVGSKYIFVYACTSELSGNSGTNMAGISTFSHEFGHTLGLADSYDTDEDGSGGENCGLSVFDIMSSGNYNAGGKIPPFYNAYQRIQLGWATPLTIDQQKEYEIQNIKYNQFYRVETSNINEYMTFEYRNNSATGFRNWDSGIDSYKYININGMVITHIDSSSTKINGVSAAEMWRNNIPNANPDHMCVRYISSNRSIADGSLDFYDGAYFPGVIGNTSFGPESNPVAKDWSGNELLIDLTDIRVDGDVVKFTNNIAPFNVTSGVNSLTFYLNTPYTIYIYGWNELGGGEYFESDEIPERQYTITGLKPDTEYSVTVYGIEDGKDIEILYKDYKTLPLSDSYPTIIFSATQEVDSFKFNPVLQNFDGNGEVEWFLDGTATELSPYTETISLGEHNLVCKITNNGKSEYITLTFTVI